MSFKKSNENSILYLIDKDGNAQELYSCNSDDLKLSDFSDNMDTDKIKEFQKSTDNLMDFELSFDAPIGRKTRNALIKSLHIALNDTNNYKKFHHRPMKRNRKFRCKVYKYVGDRIIDDEKKLVFAEEDRLNHLKIITYDGTERFFNIWYL